MIHIVNGNSTLALLKETPIQGTFLVWKDMLMEGPVKMGKTGLDWKARAVYLKDRYGIDGKDYLSGVKTFFKTLERAARGNEEVTLWFEEDFFCQLHLVYLLANLPAALLKKSRASIICPSKPLGVHMPKGLEKLYAKKAPLERDRIALAKKVWKAYTIGTPAAWETLLRWAQAGKGFAPWQPLLRGLRAHLGRQPDRNGGLNAVEASMVRALAGGPLSFPQFFRRTWIEPHVRPLGLGDLQMARYALDFAARAKPLLKIEGPGSSHTKGKTLRFKDWKLQLTADGKALFAGKKA